MSSVQVAQSFGRAGTTGIDSGFNTTTVSGFFGKGFGDIPCDPIRPFAITGELDYNIPNTGPIGRRQHHDLVGRADAAILDSLSAVADQGLRPAEHPRQPDAAGRTRLDLGRRRNCPAADQQSRPRSCLAPARSGPDTIMRSPPRCSGRSMAPPGTTSASIGQFHLYFDDLMPNTLGKPISQW